VENCLTITGRDTVVALDAGQTFAIREGGRTVDPFSSAPGRRPASRRASKQQALA
jgi:hypothetical protein